MFLMAHMISGKAARDALFLLNFPVEFLPRMTVFAATVSLFMVIAWARKLATRSPAELVPLALLGSSAMQFLLWAVYLLHPGVSAVIFYVYMIGPNAILLSSYWSLLNERFDPRQAKKLFARVTAGGTIGGLLSGLLADRVADWLGPASLLPLLGSFQLVAFFLVRKLSAPMPPRKAKTSKPTDFVAGFRYIRSNRYLFTLASLVFLVTVSGALLDYVFKSGVSEALGRDENLVSFFALFYAFAGLATFLTQSLVAPYFFQRLGLTRSLLAQPIAYCAGVLSGLAVPGLAGLALMRGLESVTRGSIYRSGYEVCYTPVTNTEKRASKTIIDVGADRLGEAAGGVLLQGLLMAGTAGIANLALALGCLLSTFAGVLTYRMGRMYVNTLESSLIHQAREMGEEAEVLPNFNAESVVMGINADLSLTQQPFASVDSVQLPRRNSVSGTPSNPVLDAEEGSDADTAGLLAIRAGQRITDPGLLSLAMLASGDIRQVRRVLQGPVDAKMVPFLVRLLAWDEVADEVVRVLRVAPFPLEGQLADALLNRDEEFAIRRRVPRVLAARPCQLSAEATLQGLRDQRFEVRFRCGRALASIVSADGGLLVDRDRVLRSIERECFVSKTVWNSYRLLEHVAAPDENPYFDEVLKDRTSKGLEHVFTLLSLVLPPEPLKIAFKGLHTSDPYLRGTALEYLESVLPDSIRERLWPLLESDKASKGIQPHQRRTREQLLAELRRSNQSIIINLERAQTQKTETDGNGGNPTVAE